MQNVVKEVYFDQYCKSCEFENVKESEDPCCECLAEPSNFNSHKPVRWKKKQ